MASAECEIERLAGETSNLHTKLEENTRLSKRITAQEQWEFDRLRREFDVRKRGFQQKDEKLRKELQELIARQDGTQYQMDKEEEVAQEESDNETGRQFNRRTY
jgi:hypothetical protein